MRVLQARNVHQVFPMALRLLEHHGVERSSRNGPVKIAPWPVTTVYTHPMERVIFWPERDANPFFHFYEALWMLAGRRDVEPLLRYAKNMAAFSDDGSTQYGAYGHRWRHHFGEYNYVHQETEPMDQISHIANTLKRNPDDRRCVLQMWDPSADLSHQGKDVPCNVTATFQRGLDGALNLTVFCRSNDLIWGCYGANAVHMSFLLEYMALAIGCPVGIYTQVSVNWHAYLTTLEKVAGIPSLDDDYKLDGLEDCPYSADGDEITPIPLGPSFEGVDAQIEELLLHEQTGFNLPRHLTIDSLFFDMAYILLRAHHAYRTTEGPDRYRKALDLLDLGDCRADWIYAGKEWMIRRMEKAGVKLGV